MSARCVDCGRTKGAAVHVDWHARRDFHFFVKATPCARCGSFDGDGHRCVVRLTSSASATPQRDTSICSHPIGCEHYS